MTKLFNRIGHVIHDHAGWMLSITLLLTVIVGVGLPKITMDTSNSIFVSKSAKLSHDSTKYEKHFGGSTYIIDVTKGGHSTVTPATLKKVAKFTKAAGKQSGVHATTSVVDVLNAQLKATNSTNTQGTQNKKLQTAMMAQLTAKQKQQLQKQLTASLTTSQQAQVAKYTQSLLTPAQQQMMAKAMAAGGQTSAASSSAGLTKLLTVSQQQKVQAFMMSTLTKQQQAKLSQTMQSFLPTAQNMNADLLHQLIYSKNGRIPSQLNQLLPKNGRHLMITVTLNGDVNQGTFKARTKRVQQLLKAQGLQSDGLTSKVDGMPAISGSITDIMSQSMLIMLVVGVILMIVILSLVFQVRRRLLPLVFVLVGLIWTFGLMGWLGINLTMATMATLPIIIGLGTDFGVQFLNRYEEEYAHSHNVQQATTVTITHTGPAVGTAVIVMALSFLTMLISRAPMMQNFGITLAVGVIVCYLVELVLMFAVLTLRDRRLANRPTKPVKVVQQSWLSRGLTRYATWVTKHSIVIIILGVLLGGAGFFFESQIKVETNMMKMVPQDIPALKRTNQLSNLLGSTTNLTYLVSADDARNQTTLKTIQQFGAKEKAKYGHQKIQAVTSLGSTLQQNGRLNGSQQQLNQTIKQTPQVMKSTLISDNHQYATISFRVNPKMGSDKMLTLMNQISQDAKNYHKPAGMTIVAAGSEAMMLQGIQNMTANHELIIFAGLAIILIVLLLVYRNWRNALYPLIPIIIVLGLSPMTLKLLGISYNPVTIALSSLVLGIGTEFTILVLERYIEELRSGRSTLVAIQTAMGSVGQAITVSGLTVIGGFSTLLFVHFPVLNSFGLITVLDTAYSLISALTILPAVMYLFRNRSLDMKK